MTYIKKIRNKIFISIIYIIFISLETNKWLTNTTQVPTIIPTNKYILMEQVT